jgi:hypothetical protein
MQGEIAAWHEAKKIKHPRTPHQGFAIQIKDDTELSLAILIEAPYL